MVKSKSKILLVIILTICITYCITTTVFADNAIIIGGNNASTNTIDNTTDNTVDNTVDNTTNTTNTTNTIGNNTTTISPITTVKKSSSANPNWYGLVKPYMSTGTTTWSSTAQTKSTNRWAKTAPPTISATPTVALPRVGNAASLFLKGPKPVPTACVLSTWPPIRLTAGLTRYSVSSTTS